MGFWGLSWFCKSFSVSKSSNWGLKKPLPNGLWRGYSNFLQVPQDDPPKFPQKFCLATFHAFSKPIESTLILSDAPGTLSLTVF